jgi:hypothetical protein
LVAEDGTLHRLAAPHHDATPAVAEPLPPVAAFRAGTVILKAVRMAWIRPSDDMPIGEQC